MSGTAIGSTKRRSSADLSKSGRRSSMSLSNSKSKSSTSLKKKTSKTKPKKSKSNEKMSINVDVSEVCSVDIDVVDRCSRRNGSPDILCGNVTKLSMAKNGCAHRILHTGISLELILLCLKLFPFPRFFSLKIEK